MGRADLERGGAWKTWMPVEYTPVLNYAVLNYAANKNKTEESCEVETEEETVRKGTKHRPLTETELRHGSLTVLKYGPTL